VAETLYAKCGDLSLAYQVFGDGPVELVFVGPTIGSHVELFWALAEFKAFFDQLATFCRVLLFDQAGFGLSDPIPKVRTLDDRAAEIEAVMDAVGFGKAAIFAVGEGGLVSMVFAATQPERTRALILNGTTAYHGVTGWDDIDRDAAELRARVLAELGEHYTPSVEQIARIQAIGRAIRSGWGSGAAFRVALPSFGSIRQLAMWERMCASPGMARASFESVFRIDVRPILPTIGAPTVVVHARDDIVPVQFGRYLADHIPGARYLEVDGETQAPWFTDPDTILTEIEEFLTGSHAAPAQSHRALRTVLFTDMVASTERAAATGDERWRAVLHRFGEITAELTQRFGGTVVKSTGDGHLATFDGPTQHSASRSAPASIPASVNCWTPTSGVLRYTSRRGSSATRVPATFLSRAPCATWWSARVRGSWTAAASSCVACPAPGNCWRSIATARGWDRPRRNWRQCPRLAVGPQCAARTAPWRRSGGVHRGFYAGWPASPRPPAAAEQPESVRLEVSESTHR
jgi:pimeloyl-ACP methyl ester carboxylesterase